MRMYKTTTSVSVIVEFENSARVLNDQIRDKFLLLNELDIPFEIIGCSVYMEIGENEYQFIMYSDAFYNFVSGLSAMMEHIEASET